MPAESQTLADWLAYIERVHPRAIEMGLERVRAVWNAMEISITFPVITIGGTNGKGSACMMLEAILHHAGYRTGCYTSPHLIRYNERVRVARTEADDAALAQAFEVVERARVRTDVALTYFEFGTLAAMQLFATQRVDVAILEVGLGGRLDAVNIFDADCAMVMSVDIDHVDYLGDTREKIGFEKAGIFRTGRPAICADTDPPRSLIDHATQIGARLMRVNRDYRYDAQPTQWRYYGPGGDRHGLPYPALRGDYQLGNAAACITALDVLRERLPVTMGDLRTGLLTAENPGRFQVLPGQPMVILDVAHNPHAARALAKNLRAIGTKGAKGAKERNRTLAVFSMLADKDICGVVEHLKPHVDQWHVAGLNISRGLTALALAGKLADAGVSGNITLHDNIAQAWCAARDAASDGDKILIFGSFHTVSEAMLALRAGAPEN